jgi:pimeloyl-ACP methyl ester carboxylesterase
MMQNFFNFLLKRWRFLLSLLKMNLISIILLLFSNCFPINIFDSDSANEAKNASNKISLITGSCKFQSRIISYTTSGDSQDLLLVFIHGSPGSWDNFDYFLQQKDLINKVQMVSFDRLGYGKSKETSLQFKMHHSYHLQAEVSLTNHAMSIANCLKQNFPQQKWILLGHSYGGPVVAKIAMIEKKLNPEGNQKITHLVLVASSIDPSLEKKEWFNSLAENPVIQWILPESFVISNIEILALEQELTNMIPDWVKITVPTTIVHGKKDSLVPFDNVEFAKRHLVHSQVKIFENEEWNHFIPWNQKEALTQILLSILHQENFIPSK